VSARPDFLDSEQLPQPAKQRRSIDKRARLMTAALDLFAIHGYAATSIDAIAVRASLAIGTFYQHFESKRQLLIVLMDQLLQQLAEVSLDIQPSATTRGTLHALLASAFERDLAFVGAYRAWQEAIIGDAELQKKNDAMHAWTRQRVFRVLTALQQSPGARRGVDLSTLADVLDEFLWSLMSTAMHMPKRERSRRVEVAADLIYHAMFSDNAAAPRRLARRKA
jgi:AcrR family transcriptional regulator